MRFINAPSAISGLWDQGGDCGNYCTVVRPGDRLYSRAEQDWGGCNPYKDMINPRKGLVRVKCIVFLRRVTFSPGVK